MTKTPTVLDWRAEDAPAVRAEWAGFDWLRFAKKQKNEVVLSWERGGRFICRGRVLAGFSIQKLHDLRVGGKPNGGIAI
ncbi:MAG: hypothetical protein ACF8AM_08115 [Rhodopirellula sp. JB055]|uniref:hypothetical protein n=1 Tax=Rhodopirellula sp. JB055 TaxID=3342846 RepID=UPI003709F223